MAVVAAPSCSACSCTGASTSAAAASATARVVITSVVGRITPIAGPSLMVLCASGWMTTETPEVAVLRCLAPVMQVVMRVQRRVVPAIAMLRLLRLRRRKGRGRLVHARRVAAVTGRVGSTDNAVVQGRTRSRGDLAVAKRFERLVGAGLGVTVMLSQRLVVSRKARPAENVRDPTAKGSVSAALRLVRPGLR